MILKKKCPTCKVDVEVIREFRTGDLKVTQYFCNHYYTRRILGAKDIALVSSDGKTPFKFQLQGAEFALNADARVLIADQMGLGKTVQALMTLNALKKKYLVIVKSGLRMQWMKEAVRWCGMEMMPQILEGEDEFVLPLRGYVVSYDILRRFKDILAWVKRLGVEVVVLDEIQHIKNHASQRTNCVRKVVDCVPHVLALSGTPIKNHAGEFFPILNMLRPDKFYSPSAFERDWVDTYWDGKKMKTGGLKNPKRFEEYTKDFIIRRTREEVMPDLPVITRAALFAELGADVEKAYKESFKQFQTYFNDSGSDSAIQRQANILAMLSKMRHLAGVAKIEPCIEYVADFLENTDRKITIFVHHKDVGIALKAQLEQIEQKDFDNPSGPILTLSADMNAIQRQDTVDKFWSSNHRVLIASTLASGEGLNLQCCSDCIMLERQWNPANEEQAESRFVRIGQTASAVTATYFVAVGTVDEFFAELVERKRALVSNSLDKTELAWTEVSLIQELAEVLASKGGKRWGW